MHNKVLLLNGQFNKYRYQELADELLTDSDVPLLIYISSDGGDESYGRAAAGLIAFCQANGRVINTLGFGNIHSTAVLVFAAGQKRLLSKYAAIMVHESECIVEGNSTQFKKQAKQMERDEQFWCKAMAELTGTDAKTWLKLHEEETYLQPEEALKLNLATEIV